MAELVKVPRETNMKRHPEGTKGVATMEVNLDDTKWVEVPLYGFCQVCGQAVRPKGKGSHRRKHPGQNVTYSPIHPSATGVVLTMEKV